MTTISQALAQAQALGLERLDAQLLLLHALGTAPADFGSRRTWLLAHGDEALAADAGLVFEHAVWRRAAGEPLAYVTGYREFFGLGLNVNAHVLVPRPDTETLVLWALEVLAGPIAAGFAAPLAALDLGTGSGAIALALKHARPDIQVDAVEASLEALTVARANAANLRLEIRFSHGSWLDTVQRQYHCIVSNPPYVASGDLHLQALAHEPQAALVSGADGLKDIRHIITAAKAHLFPGGSLMVEHGFDQAERVRGLFNSAGYQDVASRLDLGGHPRCTGGRIPGKIIEAATLADQH